MNEHPGQGNNRDKPCEDEALLMTQFAVDHAPDAVFWIDENARFVYVNAAACQSLGYSYDELLQMSVPDIDPTWPVERWQATWDALKEQGSATFETVHQTKQGRIFPVEIRTNFIEYGGKSMDCAYARDISARKTTEETLRLTQYAIDNISDIALWITPDAHIIYANKAATGILGYTSDELLGMTVFDLNSEFTADLWPAHWEEVREKRVFTMEAPIRSKDGRLIPAEVRVNFVEFEGKEYHHTFVRDITERKRAEEALVLSEQRFRGLIENSTDGILSVDPELTILYASPSVSRLSGYAPDELVGHRILDFIHPDDYTFTEKTLAECLANPGTPIYVSVRARRKDGPWRITEGNVTNLLDVPAVEAIIVNYRDITERREAEEAVRAGEQLLRQFVEHTPAAVAMFDRDMRYLVYSKRWMTDYRLGDRDITGLTHYEVFRNIPERWKEDHRNVLKGATLRSEEDMFERLDGTIDYLKWEVRPWRDAEGNIGGIIMFTEVITESKRAEFALRASEERLRLALSAGNQGTYDLDLRTGEAVTSPEHALMLGYDPADFHETYQRWLNRIHPEDRKHVNEVYTAYVHGEIPEYQVEARHATKNGEWKWILSSGKIIEWDSDGNPIRMVGVNADITELKQATEALRKANRTLAALSRVNEILVRATEESELLHDVCQAIVETGGYVMAWVGFAEDDRDKSVRPVAHAGREEGYLNDVAISWADDRLGRCPAGTAIRTRKMCVVNDVSTEPSYAPWREDAMKRGYMCSISLPLTMNGTAIGAVSLYGAEPGCLDPAEENLLAQLASDLSYGIASLRARKQQREAEEERRAFEQRLEEHKRRFYREAILSVTNGKLDICDLSDVKPYIASAQVRVDVDEAMDVRRARHEIEAFCRGYGLDGDALSAFMIGAGEAVTNALKHGNSGRVYAGIREHELWIAVKDKGAGIESLILPRAVLWRGFSTKPSLGLGYTIMLDVADRILLRTGRRGTTVILIKSLIERTAASLDSVCEIWENLPELAG